MKIFSINFLEYKFVYYAFALKSSWRGRVDESSSSPEGRNSIEREESGETTREIRDAQTEAEASSRCAVELGERRKCREKRNAKAPHTYS